MCRIVGEPISLKFQPGLNQMYVRPEGFELPGLKLISVESKGSSPEVRVRFKWREVVTVLLRRLERGMWDEERLEARAAHQRMMDLIPW